MPLHARVAEDHSEAMRSLGLLFGDLLKDEVVEGLEVLWSQVFLRLHVVDLEVDHTSVGKHYKSLLPVAKEAFRFLLQSSHFTNAGKVVAHDLHGKSGVPLLNLLLETLVAHQKLLLVKAVGSNHRISKSIIVSHIFVVDRLTLSQLSKCLQSAQVMVHTTSFLGV